MSFFEMSILTLASIGVIFMLISAIGVLRLPDVYARMHAAGKAGTLGVAGLLLAAGIFFGAGIFWRMVVLIALFFITAPIATTSMARAAYRVSKPEEKFVLHYDDMAKQNQPPPTE